MLRQLKRKVHEKIMFSRMFCKEETGPEPAAAPGSGVERGGGAGGSIREAGGAMGKRGAVREEEYFIKKQNEQLEDIKKQQDDKK